MLELKVSFKSSIYIQGPGGNNEMKMGELSGRSRINASAIRYYERRGLLPAPHRAGGQVSCRRTRPRAPYPLCRREGIHVAGDRSFSQWVAGRRTGRTALEKTRAPKDSGSPGERPARAAPEIAPRTPSALPVHFTSSLCYVKRLSLSPNLRLIGRGAKSLSN
jgi:hypothetical protein